MKLYFATGNKHKLTEAREILKGYEIERLDCDYPEIRSNSVEDVALDGVKYVVEKTGKACFVEDTGLFIDALKGFPGTYSKFVFERIGWQGILRLLQDETNRSAKFISAVAYLEPESEPRCFVGEAAGLIAHKASGDGGFGYDPIFIPTGRQKTFAEEPVTKHKLSHRCKALLGLKRWLKNV